MAQIRLSLRCLLFFDTAGWSSGSTEGALSNEQVKEERRKKKEEREEEEEKEIGIGVSGERWGIRRER